MGGIQGWGEIMGFKSEIWGGKEGRWGMWGEMGNLGGVTGVGGEKWR